MSRQKVIRIITFSYSSICNVLMVDRTLPRAGMRGVSYPPLSATCLSKAAKVDFRDMSTAVATELCCRGGLVI
jgi:hypothetical protein